MWEVKANYTEGKTWTIDESPMCQVNQKRILQNISWDITKETRNSI